MDQNDFHSPDTEDSTFHDHQNDNENNTEPDTANTPKQEEETHRINVVIPKDVAKVAKQAVFLLDMTLSDYVAEALEEKNERTKEKVREALL